mgnify:CR=1 FL=1
MLILGKIEAVVQQIDNCIPTKRKKYNDCLAYDFLVYAPQSTQQSSIVIIYYRYFFEIRFRLYKEYLHFNK